MHSLLEEYLEKVNAHLWALPRAQRADELREMQAHLARLTADAVERGQSEEEAARSAIRHFGYPQTVGRDMSRAWARGLVRGLRDGIPGTSLLAGTLLYLPMILLRAMAPEAVTLSSTTGWTIAWSALVGGYVGWKLSSKSAATMGIATLCTSVLGTFLIPFFQWHTDGTIALPKLTLAAFSNMPLGFLAWIMLMYTAGYSAFLLPFAFTGRFLARRRSSKA